ASVGATSRASRASARLQSARDSRDIALVTHESPIRSRRTHKLAVSLLSPAISSGERAAQRVDLVAVDTAPPSLQTWQEIANRVGLDDAVGTPVGLDEHVDA